MAGSSYAEAKAFLEECVPDLPDIIPDGDKLAAAIVVVLRRADILARYIAHVGENEGTDFLDGWRDLDKFGEADALELRAASEETRR
jgi:hypothetical protein